MILIVDNYDSFTYNIHQYIREFSDIKVLRNDHKDLYKEAENAKGIVFSPGPGWPKDAGKMNQMILDFKEKKPILGICLGHQAICEVFGGKLALAKKVMHGKQSIIKLKTPSKIYKDIKDKTKVMRYHSIVIEELPKNFDVLSIATDDNSIMAISHKSLPIFGFQYHLESIGTESGLQTIKNFVDIVKSS